MLARQMKKNPKPTPDSTAIASGRNPIGPCGWSSGCREISVTATRPSATPSQASRCGRSPCSTPAATGTTPDITAVTGEITFIGAWASAL